MEVNSSTTMSVKSARAKNEIVWVIDTGVERHLIYRLDLLSNVREEEITCVLPKNTEFKTTHVGDMKLKTIVDGVKKDLLIKEVYYRQDLGANPLSHALIDEKGCFILKQGDQHFISVMTMAKRSWSSRSRETYTLVQPSASPRLKLLSKRAKSSVRTEPILEPRGIQ
jgi:hypothetical protein